MMKRRKNRLIAFCLAGEADDLLAVTHYLSLFKTVRLGTSGARLVDAVGTENEAEQAIALSPGESVLIWYLQSGKTFPLPQLLLRLLPSSSVSTM